MKITSLFQIVLTMSVMGSVVAGLVLLTKKLIGNKFSAAWHYYIWFLILIRLAVPYAPESSFSIFNLTGSLPHNIGILQSFERNNNMISAALKVTGSSQPQNDYQEVSNKDSHIISTAAADPDGVEKRSYENSLGILGKIWFGGMLAMIFYMIGINILFSYKNRRKEECRDERIIGILEECKSRLKAAVIPRVVYDSNGKTPMLFGYIKPRIFIAPEVIQELSQEEIEYILLHELVHIKRRDILINWIMMVLQAIHWFNPVIWYAFYRMKLDNEIACDARVLSYLKPVERHQYGQTIINLLKIISRPSWTPGMVGIVNSKTDVQRRIMMIKKFKKTSLKWTIIAAVIIVMVGYIGLTNSKGLAKEAPAVDKDREIAISPVDYSAKESSPKQEDGKNKSEAVAETKEDKTINEEAPVQSKPSANTGASQEYQVPVKVDMEIVKNDQKQVDQGHTPWQLDPLQVTQTFVSLKISPKGIVGDFPIKYEDLKVVSDNSKEAVVEIAGDKTPIRKVYLERLVRQDKSGIWSVVGYDPVK